MEQITHGGGGYVGRESADRKTLLYQPALRTSPVMAQPLAGGRTGHADRVRDRYRGGGH